MKKNIILIALFTILPYILFSQAETDKSTEPKTGERILFTPGNGSFTLKNKPYKTPYALMITNSGNETLLLLASSSVWEEEDPTYQIGFRHIVLDDSLPEQTFTFSQREDDHQKYFNEAYCKVSDFITDEELEEGKSGTLIFTKDNNEYQVKYDLTFKGGIRVEGSYSGYINQYTEDEWYALLHGQEESSDVICETGKGSFSYNGKKYELHYAVFDKYEEDYTLRLYDFNNNCSYADYYIQFSFKGFEEGTYTYGPYYDDGYDKFNNFYAFSYSNYDSGDYFGCTKGSVTLQKNGDNTYTFTFNVTMENNKNLKGSFTGTYDYKEHKYDDYDYNQYGVSVPDLSLFTDLEINSGKISDYQNIISINKRYFPINYAGIIPKTNAAYVCFMSGPPEDFNRLDSLQTSGTYIFFVKLSVDQETKEIAEAPLFYESSSYYADPEIHFSTAYCYFLKKDGTFSAFTECKEGFFSTKKDNDAYIFDFILIFEGKTILNGRYKGTPESSMEFNLAKLPYFYDDSYDYSYYNYDYYEKEKDIMETPFPDFLPEEITLENSFSKNYSAPIVLPYAYLINDEENRISSLMIMDKMLEGDEWPNYTLTFVFPEYMDRLADTTMFYRNDYSYSYYTNAINRIDMLVRNVENASFYEYQSGALYIDENEDVYKITYRMDSYEEDITTGSFTGKINTYTRKELSRLYDKKLSEKPLGKGLMATKGSAIILTSCFLIIDSERYPGEAVCFLSTNDLLFSNSGGYVFAFCISLQDGNIPAGSFSYKKDTDDKKYDSGKNFHSGFFASYDERGYYSNIYKELKKGDIIIEKGEDNLYTITFEGVMDEKETVKGNYKGFIQKIIREN